LKIIENSVFCLNDHILLAIFEDGGVVFNLKARMSFLINCTGAGIIRLLDGKKNIGEVIHNFAQVYEKQEAFVKDDAMNFFKSLLERGWVHVK